MFISDTTLIISAVLALAGAAVIVFLFSRGGAHETDNTDRAIAAGLLLLSTFSFFSMSAIAIQLLYNLFT